MRRESNGIIRLIAAFRFLKAIALILLAFNALKLLNPSTSARLAHWAEQFPYVTQHAALHRTLASLFHLPRQRVEVAAIAMVAYAALFLTEGVGLWLGRVWAEYLTIVATASFIPFEIYELVRKVSVPRLSALVINVAILGYLVLRRWRRRRSL